MDMEKYQPVVNEPATRSGILALIPKVSNARQICKELEANNIIVTPRDGFIRFAPHLCTTNDEIDQAVAALNNIV